MWIARHVVRVAWLCLAVACQERNPAFVGATTGSTGTTDPSTSSPTTSPPTTTTTTTESESDAGTTTTDSEASSSSTETGVDPACFDDPLPTGGECPAECSGGCERPGLCAIDCSGGCPDEVVCAEGFACTITCINGDCQGATLRCVGDHACWITCSGNNTCRDATFVCASGSCTVDCTSGVNACRDGSLQCGLSDSRACGGSNVDAVPADGSACSCVSEC